MMPLFRTSKDLVEDCLTISLKQLRQWGYLAPDSFRGGSIQFSRGGRATASLGMTVSTFEGDEYLRLQYTINYAADRKTEVDYQVPLVRHPCNIGNGYRYYFLCPVTGKRCLILYSPPWETYFLHRSAFPNLYYTLQLESKRYRRWDKSPTGILIKLQRLENELFNGKKYRRLFYKGRPTKALQRYLDLKAALDGQSIADSMNVYREILGLPKK